MLLMMTVTPACWLDWDEIDYVTPCDPLSPNTTCKSLQMRCRPQEDGDPVCEGPSADQPRQDAYCEEDDDCGVTEVCLSLDMRLPSKICMQLCRTDTDCKNVGHDYTCKTDYPMAVRGEPWGGCYGFPPSGWSCDKELYAGWAGGTNTLCNCGCGPFDPDCPDGEHQSCEKCEPEVKEWCVPRGWTCKDSRWDNGICDCGCGVMDEDCNGSTRIECSQCPEGSCAGEFNGGCGTDFAPIRPDDNAQCKDIPSGWTCTVASYFDGEICDCGCGVLDPDCHEDARDTACDRCPAGSCAASEDCSADILVDSDNSQCRAPAE